VGEARSLLYQSDRPSKIVPQIEPFNTVFVVFSDRPKAEAFANAVGGEVGKP